MFFTIIICLWISHHIINRVDKIKTYWRNIIFPDDALFLSTEYDLLRNYISVRVVFSTTTLPGHGTFYYDRFSIMQLDFFLPIS